MTVSEYILSCKLAKLSIQELDYMTIGFALDLIQEYSVFQNPKLEGPKEATQKDIQSLKGR